MSALSRCRPSTVPMMVLAACGGPSPLLPPPPHTAATNSGGGIASSSKEDSAPVYDPYFRVASGCGNNVNEELAECCGVLCGGGVAEMGLWHSFKMLVSTACWLTCCLPCVCAR